MAAWPACISLIGNGRSSNRSCRLRLGLDDRAPMHAAVEAITPADAAAWFAHAGYALPALGN
jgi:hypothetical protein